jgi:hypothetical protein
MNIDPNILFSSFTGEKDKKITKKPEEKKEDELEVQDRLYLVSKKIEDSFLIHTFLDILSTQSFECSFETTNMNSYVIDDIEMFHDHYLNEEKGIFSKIDYTKTKMGKEVFKRICSKPIYDIKILKRRQKMIMDLSRVKKEIEIRLLKIREVENDFIWFWDKKGLNHIDMMNDLIYFNYDIIPFFNVNEVLNKNEKALLITNIYKIVGAPILTAVSPLISLLVPLIVFIIGQKKLGLNMTLTDVIKLYFKTIYNFNPVQMFSKPSFKTQLLGVLSKMFYIFMYFQNVYYSIQSSKNTNQMINVIHDKLNKMNIYIQNTKEIFDICKNAGITKLETFMEKENVIFEDFEQIHHILHSNVFQQNPSLFSHKGKILVAFQEFRKKKHLLHSCFQYVSYIDSILSISHLLNTSTDSHPYSFVEFYENKNKPSISIEKIWHPYLISSICPNTVQNDIQLKNNILITGPNAAGKSTFIKSVIVNILLAQTCCIASAQQFKFTPFHLIETYLHIPDSKGNQSLFEAEMYRSRDYLHRLKELEGKCFSFIVLDEIFSSTNFIEGFSGAYAILKKISSFQNTLSMTTTHYSDLEILERDTQGRFENYHFEVTHDNQQNILFNYRLKRGTSRQYIALELLRKNGFDDDLIETAIEMSKNIEIKNKKYKINKNKTNKNKTNKNKMSKKQIRKNKKQK